MEWVKKVDEGSEVGRWKGWKRVDGMSGVRLDGREKGKEWVRMWVGWWMVDRG